MENLQILPESDYREVEGRNYINPNLPIDRTNRFIDNLRANQQANAVEIAQQTEALGTTVPSSEGGLTGAGSYFSSRYATPQQLSVAQNLRTAAQAAALNEALANEQAMWKQRYNQAYRDYQMRNYRKSERDRNRMYNSGNTGGGSATKGNVVEEEEDTYTIEGSVPGTPGGYTVPNIDTETGKILGYTYVPYGEDYQTNYTYNVGQKAPVTNQVWEEFLEKNSSNPFQNNNPFRR